MAAESAKDPRHAMIEEQTRQIAQDLRAGLPPGIGFALVLFHFGPGGFLSYAANADRGDFVKALRELLAKIDPPGAGGPL